MLVLLAPVQDSGLQPWMGVRISELGAQSRGMLQASDLHFQSVSICLSSSVPLSSANCSLDIQQTPLPPRWQDFLIHDWVGIGQAPGGHDDETFRTGLFMFRGLG